MVVHDLLVVGLGPAGVTAVVQARRDGLDVVAVGDEPPGGLVAAARRIENLPVWPQGIAGRVLARRMARWVRTSNAAVVQDTVIALDRTDSGIFSCATRRGAVFLARSVCLAPGTRPVPLPPELFGLGCPVFRDIRNLPRRKGAVVAVVGGGDAAFDTALSVADLGMRPVLWVRGKVKASQGLVEEVEARRIPVAASLIPEAELVVACIGREVRDELLLALLPEGLPSDICTAVPGLFVAGDAIRGRERFVATAMGDGQRAAIMAREYLGGGDT